MEKQEFTLMVIVISIVSVISILMPYMDILSVGNINGIEIVAGNGAFVFPDFLRMMVSLFTFSNCFIPLVVLMYDNHPKVISKFLKVPFFIVLCIATYLLQAISLDMEKNAITYTHSDNPFIGLLNMLKLGYWVAIINSSILLFFSQKVVRYNNLA